MKKDDSCHESCHWLNDEINSKEVMLHELQVHQIELEMQNRQLREAQLELEETRDSYADLYDFAPVGYLTLDDAGMVQNINLTGAAMLESERLNILGKPFINFLTPHGIQEFMTYLRQTFEKPGKSETEILIRIKQGKTRLVGLVGMAGGEKNRKCRIVMNDITMQRKGAVELQISRSAQSALLNAIPSLVFYQDINLRFKNVSHAFADFVGLAPEEVVGKTVYELFPDEVAEDLHRVSTSVLQTGMALYGFESSIPDANGNLVYLSTVLAPYRDAQNKVIGLVGASIDVSTFKNIQNSNSKLLGQNRLLTHNLFVAHEQERRYLARELHDELGQWFTAIQTEAHIIANIEKHDPVIHQSALAISNSASAAHEVIRGMVRHLRPSLLDELGLADSLLELQQQWGSNYPDLVCEFKLGDGIEKLGEELNVTIYRLIQESFNNIARHAQAHKIIVSVHKEPQVGASILLKIEDDGTGFDTTLQRDGIGLLGMRERVIAAGGLFYIKSAPGAGTTIEARLPLVNYSAVSNKRRVNDS